MAGSVLSLSRGAMVWLVGLACDITCLYLILCHYSCFLCWMITLKSFPMYLHLMSFTRSSIGVVLYTSFEGQCSPAIVTRL